MPPLTPDNHSAASLRAAEKRLKILISQIGAIADAMDDAGLEVLRVPQSAALGRLLDDVPRFVSSAQVAVNQAMAAKGLFRAAPAAEAATSAAPPAKSPAKKKKK